jgi:hypothetical protein
MLLPTSSANPHGSLDFISASLFFQKLLGSIKISIVYHPQFREHLNERNLTRQTGSLLISYRAKDTIGAQKLL